MEFSTLTPIVPTAQGFLSVVDFTPVLKTILSIGAGLAAIGAIFLAVLKGYLMLTGKVLVKGHGLWDADVYDAAMQDLQRHYRAGGILDRESRSALASYQLHHPDILTKRRARPERSEDGRASRLPYHDIFRSDSE